MTQLIRKARESLLPICWFYGPVIKFEGINFLIFLLIFFCGRFAQFAPKAIKHFMCFRSGEQTNLME